MNEDCIFCKIVAGDIPAELIYEDDWVIAFDDIAKQAPVHTLIVPKQHVASLNDYPSPTLLGHIFSTAVRVAELKGIKHSGYRVIQNNGEDSGQTVPHLHVHVLGGRPLGEGLV